MHKDNYLLAVGLSEASTKATRAVAEIQPNFESVTTPYGEYIRRGWDSLCKVNENSGSAFEILVSSVLFAGGLVNISRGVTLPNCENNPVDILIKDSKEQPIAALMLTSTLRERFRLADLQSFRYKSFHSGIQCFQLTMDRNEVARKSDYKFDSLDELIYTGGLRFDAMIAAMQERV
jgi:hypothetical protein